MNTLVATLVRQWRMVVALAVVIPFFVVTSVIDRHLPVLVIPLVPAAGIAALLVTLGVIVGRAYGPATSRRPDPAPQVTASAIRPVTRSSARALPDSAPTYAVLPAVRQNGDAA
jgi:hypothetical protein